MSNSTAKKTIFTLFWTAQLVVVTTVSGATATFTPVGSSTVPPGTNVVFEVTVSVNTLAAFDTADILVGSDAATDIAFVYSTEWTNAFATVTSPVFDTGTYSQDAFLGGNNTTAVGTSLLLGTVTVATTGMSTGTFNVTINNSFDGVSTLGLAGEPDPLNGNGEFTITVSVPILCSSAGTMTLNQTDYSCEDTVIIRVVDCDLNFSDLVVDTVNISIASNTETLSENVLLTETAVDSSVFSGSISLSSIDSPGVLQVANLDTVTATYTDADDGLGGIDVVQIDTATTSCSLPTISVAVQLQGIDTALIRDVTFVITDCSAPQSETITLPVSFDATGNGTVDLSTSLLNASWISADESHSLRRLIQLVAPLPSNVSFTGAASLLTGNFSGDDLVDVEDFSILASNWNLVGSLADINGDNLQSTVDFTAIAVNILTIGDALDGCVP